MIQPNLTATSKSRCLSANVSEAQFNKLPFVSLLLTFLLIVLVFATPAVTSEVPVNLLRQKGFKIKAGWKESSVNLSTLTDGDAATYVTAPRQASGSAMRLACHCGGEFFTVEKLVVQLPPPVAANARASTVELLTWSRRDGYSSLRVGRLENTSHAQQFVIRPIPTQWVVIRVNPSSESNQVSVAEVELLGFKRRPVTAYMRKYEKSPIEALRLLSRLDHSPDYQVSIDEESMISDAADGRLDRWSLAEAALFASGVSDPAKRKKYLKQIDRLEETARNVIDRKKSMGIKHRDILALKLLQWLRDNTMSKGYKEGQTDLSTVLDQGSYNCVSSTALFNIMGRRLGFDLRTIRMPGHVFSICYDRDMHVDVETTATRPGIGCGLQTARDLTDPDWKDRRELRETGLVACIYFNHANFLFKSKQYDQALVKLLCVLALDPDDNDSAESVAAAIDGWILNLADKNDYRKAFQVACYGLAISPREQKTQQRFQTRRFEVMFDWANAEWDNDRLDRAFKVLLSAIKFAPQDSRLRKNLRVVVREWAVQVSERQGLVAAQQMLARILRDHPEVPEIRTGATAYLQQRVLKSIKTAQFTSALATTDQFTSMLGNKNEARSLAQVVCDAWASAALKMNDWHAATQAYDEGLKRFPGDSHLTHNAGVIWDNWGRSCIRAKDWKGAVRIYEQAVERFPQNRSSNSNLEYCRRQLRKHRQVG